MSVDRVFADTNVILSGILYEHGKEARILNLALLGRIRLVLAQAVIDETRRVLHNKFPEEQDEFEDFLAKADCDLIAVPSVERIKRAAALLRDPDDAPVLASILASNPDVALSGDKDLLADEVKAVAPVCRCADYLREHPELMTDN